MKILVSDFDNTFYTDNYLENIEKTKKFVAEGNLFLIATGRNVVQLHHDIEEYPIPFAYLICNDGGIIFDHDLQVLKRTDISSEIVKPLFHAFDQDRKIGETWIDTGMEYTVNDDEIANAIIARVLKERYAAKKLNVILDRFPEIHGYLSENWINLTEKSVSKGNAIHYLEVLNGWDHNQIYVVGDNVNDVSMLEKYNGFMMKHGAKELEKHSLKTVKSVSEVIDLLLDIEKPE